MSKALGHIAKTSCDFSHYIIQRKSQPLCPAATDGSHPAKAPGNHQHVRPRILPRGGGNCLKVWRSEVVAASVSMMFRCVCSFHPRNNLPNHHGVAPNWMWWASPVKKYDKGDNHSIRVFVTNSRNYRLMTCCKLASCSFWRTRGDIMSSSTKSQARSWGQMQNCGIGGGMVFWGPCLHNLQISSRKRISFAISEKNRRKL